MADKTEYALHHGLKAIVCIGETLQERESKELWNVLDRQLKVRGASAQACCSSLFVTVTLTHYKHARSQQPVCIWSLVMLSACCVVC